MPSMAQSGGAGIFIVSYPLLPLVPASSWSFSVHPFIDMSLGGHLYKLVLKWYFLGVLS